MKYIVVHSGARDQYKLAESLFENNKLGYLVTDDIIFRNKYKNIFPKQNIKISKLAFLMACILKIHNFGERAQQLRNFFLGRTAGKLSRKEQMPLMALQEYAFHAYKYSDVRPRIVFQYHPQASSNKQIFETEIKQHPESISFQKEIAIYTPQKIKDAKEELNSTDFFIAASTFTKQTLIENGAEAENIFVAPYGVNTANYPFKERIIPKIVNFVFVGSFVERKGVYYLLNAIKRLEDDGLEFRLKVTSRSGIDNSMIEKYGIKNIESHSNLSHDELIDLYHSSDVFIFPSLFEGFAFVIVEAMSTGLPVITTPRTVGPDVIDDGKDGFIIEPSNIDAIYDKMKYFILHPEKCPEMGKNASVRAKQLTWQNFEDKIIYAVNQIEKTKQL